jgi:uncharacterized protein
MVHVDRQTQTKKRTDWGLVFADLAGQMNGFGPHQHHEPCAVSQSVTSPSYLGQLSTPTVRLGVTGLARAGKTVFITSLVRNLVSGGRLPFFQAQAAGRLGRAFLDPQANDHIPRFDYEAHLACLGATPPLWPESTRAISELRVTVPFTPSALWRRTLGVDRLHVDIVDYPGEWLIDLGLMDQSYAQWSETALQAARAPHRKQTAAAWLAKLAALDPKAPQDEHTAMDAAREFTAFLQAVRAAEPAVATLGPGRFLLPGEFAGSPLVTFVPLALDGAAPANGSMAAMMQSRYNSYKQKVVAPFFREHFAKLDRQIVLVDALSAINAGPGAIDDLTQGLGAALTAFKPGMTSWLGRLLSGRKIDRILFAATKADHLMASSHDHLEAALQRITETAAQRAEFAGAEVKTLALAALRSTQEATVGKGRDLQPCLVGVPLPGERIGTTIYDGVGRAALSPGELPENLADLEPGRIRVVKFRPPKLDLGPTVAAPDPWPHVRMDRALDFLIGDKLQ